MQDQRAEFDRLGPGSEDEQNGAFHVPSTRVTQLRDRDWYQASMLFLRSRRVFFRMGMLDTALSLCQLLDPAVLANPYPLYRQLREQDPVHWDPFLHAWVVTRYPDVVTVLHRFTADRTPTPEQLSAMGCSSLNPIPPVMVKQMLFMDGATHTRLRSLASAAFSTSRVEAMRA